MPGFAEAVLIVAAYALGCFPAGYYLVRLRTGEDVRALGSGAAGARNTGRVLGPAGFTATFVLDFAKGAAACGAARWLGAGPGAAAAVLLAVVMGHVWPVHLGFRGGKGIATSLGGLAVYEPVLFLALLAAFVVVFPFVRRFTLSGLVAYALAPLGGLAFDVPKDRIAATSALAAVVIFAHRGNLLGDADRGVPACREDSAGSERSGKDDHGA